MSKARGHLLSWCSIATVGLNHQWLHRVRVEGVGQRQVNGCLRTPIAWQVSIISTVVLGLEKKGLVSDRSMVASGHL